MSGEVDRLIGEIDSTISVCRGEAQEIRSRANGSDGLREIADQLEHRARQLEDALDDLYQEDRHVE